MLNLLNASPKTLLNPLAAVGELNHPYFPDEVGLSQAISASGGGSLGSAFGEALDGLDALYLARLASMAKRSGGMAAEATSSGSSVVGSLAAGPYVSDDALIQSVAARADAWGIRNGLGKGPDAVTLKHGHAEDMLGRYQRMFGDRGLATEVRYKEVDLGAGDGYWWIRSPRCGER